MEGARMHQQAVTGVARGPESRFLRSCQFCGGPTINISRRIRQNLTSTFVRAEGVIYPKSSPVLLFHVVNHWEPRPTSANCRVFRSRSRLPQHIVPWCSGPSSRHATGKKMHLSRRIFYGHPIEMMNLGSMSDGNHPSSTRSSYGKKKFGLEAVCGSTTPAAETDSMLTNPASGISLASKEAGLLTRELPFDLQAHLMPKHVAIIMDGNARWAKRRGMQLSVGHTAGVESLRQVVKAASKWGIDVLTVFAFSTENWHRPQMEVEFLMQLFESKLFSETENIVRNNLQIRPVGNLSALSPRLQKALESVRESTRQNTGMIVNVCINYSGRADLVQACRKLAAKVADGTISPADIDEEALASEISMCELGELRYPDLLIRTSGEHRISNFLLWQAAYSELVFSETLWPDFGEEEFRAALLTYQARDRRYGRRNG